MAERYWAGQVPPRDDFNTPITDEFIDGRVKGASTWGFFNPVNWAKYGCGLLGTGYGQRYVKQANGRFLKVEG